MALWYVGWMPIESELQFSISSLDLETVSVIPWAVSTSSSGSASRLAIATGVGSKLVVQ